MLRMWVKFREEDGRRVIDRATFQTFGCQTAIAVASVATELIRGKTSAEALALSGEQLSSPLGPLPPMKIHCAQLVEDALRSALDPSSSLIPAANTHPSSSAPTLADQVTASGKVKITLI
jgi:NifU-like protein involved in Fe-S cluster formation